MAIPGPPAECRSTSGLARKLNLLPRTSVFSSSRELSVAMHSDGVKPPGPPTGPATSLGLIDGLRAGVSVPREVTSSRDGSVRGRFDGRPERNADREVEWRRRFAAAARAGGLVFYESDSRTRSITWDGDTKQLLGYEPTEMASADSASTPASSTWTLAPALLEEKYVLEFRSENVGGPSSSSSTGPSRCAGWRHGGHCVGAAGSAQPNQRVVATDHCAERPQRMLLNRRLGRVPTSCHQGRAALGSMQSFYLKFDNRTTISRRWAGD